MVEFGYITLRSIPTGTLFSKVPNFTEWHPNMRDVPVLPLGAVPCFPKPVVGQTAQSDHDDT